MNTLPNDIIREIITYNNPNADKMLMGKDRERLDINYLCMYNILTPTRIEYVKSNFKKDDIIKIYDKQDKFIRYGIICNMLHKPDNTFNRNDYKRSYKWKILFNELKDEDYSSGRLLKPSEFIGGHLTCPTFNPQIPLSLKKFNIVKYETENNHDIIMNYLKPYDIVNVIRNKRYEDDILYLGDGVFIMCWDFFFHVGGGVEDKDRLNRMHEKLIYPKYPNIMFKWIYKSQVNCHDKNALIEIDKIHPNITYHHNYIWSDYYLECVVWHKKYTGFTEEDD